MKILKICYLFSFSFLIFLASCTPNPRYYSRKQNRQFSNNVASNTQRSVHSKIYQSGTASFMAHEVHNNTTANGEKQNMYKMIAAHKTLPFNTIVEVTNKQNGKSVQVRINDRGPFVKGRIIDLSYAAAKKLDFIDAGLTQVDIRIISQNPEGD